jgi:hypothetical protein
MNMNVTGFPDGEEEEVLVENSAASIAEAQNLINLLARKAA